MANSPPDTVITSEELSGRSMISRRTLYKLPQDGDFPSQKIGWQWRFHRDAVDAWWKNQKTNE